MTAERIQVCASYDTRPSAAISCSTLASVPWADKVAREWLNVGD
jgi:hypothetical protein